MKRCEMKRCETCLGMGYKGRYRPAPKHKNPRQAKVNGRVWKIETCRRCGGSGEVR